MPTNNKTSTRAIKILHKHSAFNMHLVGLLGPDTGWEFNEPNKSMYYWPFQQQSMQRELRSLSKQYGGMLEPGFHTLEMSEGFDLVQL